MATPAEPPFALPSELDDYLILHELGRGRMGHVFLAEDVLLARPVAIKFLTGEIDPASRARFLSEARAAARIAHPNVVAIYRVGELADRPYLVYELVRGPTLAALPRPLDPARVLTLGIELARGLAAAHRRGVVHCDLKPQNAMLDEDGVVKLVDFGLARIADARVTATATSGPPVGTVDYMAPELWQGANASRRSDVYALGVTLFELASGEVPFAQLAPDQLVVNARPAPELRAVAPAIDARLSRVIARCLERDPALRYACGDELRDALERLAPGRARVGAEHGNPYRGLRAFEASHRGVFFGRDREIGEIVERLRAEAVVVVTGDSGVGKSSIARAGIIPAIADGALASGAPWRAIALVPGHAPVHALATALGAPELAAAMLADPEEIPRQLRRCAGDSGLALFIDQLEELVTVADPAEVAALDAGLARVSEGMPQVRLVATARADFLARLAALPRLGRELARLLYFVTPLPPEELRGVICGPAEATGVRFESDALVEQLVTATAAAGSGGLPLLSFALAELWEAHDRQRGLITEAASAAMGGVAGALARHADAVIAGLSASHRAEARRVLLRLVTAVGTRVRRTEAELALSPATRPVLEALVRGRLVVAHEGANGATFELAHEVLVSGWGSLCEWLEVDAEARAARERLAAAAAEWERRARRADLVWHGARLAEARALDPALLTAGERAFVVASLRSSRRRRWVGRAIALCGIVTLAAALTAQRWLVADQLAAAVADELSAADRWRAAAERADAEQRELGRAVYAKLDAGDLAGGESSWAEVVRARQSAAAAYRAAGGHLEAALAKDPQRAEVRTQLGDLIYRRALLAEQMSDADQLAELTARLGAYDVDGTRRARWDAPGSVRLRSPPDAVVTIAGPRGVRYAPAPGEALEVPRGSYVATVVAPGRAPLVLPFAIERGRATELDAEPLSAHAVPAGYVYVPAGELVYGSFADEDTRTSFLQTVPAHRRTTGPYLIARHETTIDDWLVFVDEQPAAMRAALLPALRSSLSPGLVIAGRRGAAEIEVQSLHRATRARWGERLHYAGRDRRARVAWERLPITGITARDAERYVAWLDRTGRVPRARMCTEVEWERAARGADARIYPHGDRAEPDDLNVDITYDRRGLGLDEVGSHPASLSPFGIADLSGNAFEWTRDASGAGYVARGGSYYHDRKTANVTNRYIVADGQLRDATVGLRVCASVGAEIAALPQR